MRRPNRQVALEAAGAGVACTHDCIRASRAMQRPCRWRGWAGYGASCGRTKLRPISSATEGSHFVITSRHVVSSFSRLAWRTDAAWVGGVVPR